ncbi:MAG: nucleoside monophosphate kinase [Armatimonas sp.]
MRIVLLGPPGAGKGTLGASLSASLSIPHLSTGELLRAAIREGDEEARVILSGAFVSDEVANRLILPRIAHLPGFILDGYPRTLVQAEALDAATRIDAVLLLELDDNTLEQRIAGRRVCASCGRGYHLVIAPPKAEGVCDLCEGELILRPEEDTLEKRLTRTRLYRELTAPLIIYYGGARKLHSIDAGGSPEKVVKLSQNALNTP